MKRYLPAILAALAVSAVVSAGAIKTWSTSEVIRSSDLNTTLQHLHTAAEELITNSKVASGAAISHTKLATPALLPKAWAVVAICTSGTCTVSDHSGAGEVEWVGTGEYTVTLEYDVESAFGVFLTAINEDDAFCHATAVDATANTISVKCYNPSGASPIDSSFSILVMDT